MKSQFIGIATLAAALAACATPAPTADEAALAAEGRKIALGMQQNLAGKLFAEIGKSGPAGANGGWKTMPPGAPPPVL